MAEVDYGDEYGDVAHVDARFSTEQYTAIIVGTALALLWALARGFRGVSVGGVSVGIR